MISCHILVCGSTAGQPQGCPCDCWEEKPQRLFSQPITALRIRNQMQHPINSFGSPAYRDNRAVRPDQNFPLSTFHFQLLIHIQLILHIRHYTLQGGHIADVHACAVRVGKLLLQSGQVAEFRQIALHQGDVANGEGAVAVNVVRDLGAGVVRVHFVGEPSRAVEHLESQAARLSIQSQA